MMEELFSFFGLFQIVCFIFLIRYITKLFRNYIAPFIQEALKQQKEAQEKQHQQYQLLQEHHARAQATLDQEKEASKRLLVKIALWQKAQQEKDAVIKEDRKHSQEQVKEHLKLQSHWLTLMHARQMILPEAVGLVEKKVIKQFNSSSKQQKFLDELTLFFAERVS